MKTITLGTSDLQVPSLAVGCMRIQSLDLDAARTFLNGALEVGAHFFDHADVYGQGECEEKFAQALDMNPRRRETLIIQSKCGIRQGSTPQFDFSKDHILGSVEGILRRLKTDYLDVLLLHRPDALVEPEEVAAAFDQLLTQGKVRHFGVSNHSPYQIQLLQRYVHQPLVANQLQLSITHSSMITAGLQLNMATDGAIDRDRGILDFCRLHDITIQPWSPFQRGLFMGTLIDHPELPELNQKLEQVAATYGVSKVAIVIAWILRHPAQMQPVTGTMNLGRLQDCVRGSEIHLTREEWYGIYLAAGNTLP